METKKIIDKLNDFCESLFSKNVAEADILLFEEAAERLEELESELGKRTIHDRPYEWISVEDRLPEPLTSVLAYDYKNKRVGLFCFKNPENMVSFYSHWMPLPEPPKPKEPTFKDKFLEAFPKAQLYSDGIPVACRANIFGEKCLMKSKCSECWNQPYFEEEEGEGDADNSK